MCKKENKTKSSYLIFTMRQYWKKNISNNNINNIMFKYNTIT